MLASHETQRRILVCALALFLLVGCNAPVRTPQPDSLTAEFDALVPRLLEQHDVPGAAIAVIQDGKVVWSKGYGLADKDTRRPVTPETRFQIGSVAKSLTAWGVMALVEKGKIDLDAPVDRYLTRWHLPNAGFDNNKVTVRRILSHTAGLSVRGYHGVFVSGDKLPALEESLAGYSGSDGSLSVIQEPGTGYRYSSGGFTLLQLVIEDISGEPFAAYMQRTILNPLAMTDSGYEWSPELQPAVATPHDENGVAYPYYQLVEQGSGGVFNTTASDLARFVAAAVPGTNGTPAGRGILMPETVQQMFTPADNTNGEYGLGYKVMSLSEEVHLVGHDGANEGFRAIFLMHPQQGDGLVILTNSDIGGKIMGEIGCAWSAWTGIDMSALCPATSR